MFAGIFMFGISYWTVARCTTQGEGLVSKHWARIDPRLSSYWYDTVLENRHCTSIF